MYNVLQVEVYQSHAIGFGDIHYVMGMDGSAVRDLLFNHIGVSVPNYL